MDAGFYSGGDEGADIASDVGNEFSDDGTGADFGGDLASDDGVDLSDGDMGEDIGVDFGDDVDGDLGGDEEVDLNDFDDEDVDGDFGGEDVDGDFGGDVEADLNDFDDEDDDAVFVRRPLTDDEKDIYSRPSGFRVGVRDEVWQQATNDSEDGIVRDPLTGTPLDQDESWDMGHRPGYEFRSHQQSAADRNIDRGQFIDEHNTPEHYRPELPSSNRSRAGEDKSGRYYGF